MNILSEIVEQKRKRVSAAKQEVAPDVMRTRALDSGFSRTTNAFRAALARDQLNVIAEFKRRSPSKGTIREGASAEQMALFYKQGGAAAISVLTEEDYFDGSLDDLKLIDSAVDLPLLCKDFVIDAYQIYEAAANNADAVLLIVAALSDEELKRFQLVAEAELGIDALVEVHSEAELQRAVDCGATLIGVNNRDLTTFEVSLETSIKLAEKVPAGCLLISESGLSTNQDLMRLREIGYQGFLIGESLMRAADPQAALQALLGY